MCTRRRLLSFFPALIDIAGRISLAIHVYSTKDEMNYSQLDREVLGLVFGVKTFHHYVYGRHFVLKTDHRTLTFIFGK